jgi:receptor protein-tyrosine kinase
VPPHPDELMAGGSFERLLAELAERFAVILIDTPAARTANDLFPTAAAAGAALIVARRDRSRAPEVAQLAGGLASAGVNVLGATLNGG